jgi:hypothetical protein
MSIGWTLAQTWTGAVVIVTALASAELNIRLGADCMAW